VIAHVLKVLSAYFPSTLSLSNGREEMMKKSIRGKIVEASSGHRAIKYERVTALTRNDSLLKISFTRFEIINFE
jgi:hypothetical protein